MITIQYRFFRKIISNELTVVSSPILDSSEKHPFRFKTICLQSLRSSCCQSKCFAGNLTQIYEKNIEAAFFHHKNSVVMKLSAIISMFIWIIGHTHVSYANIEHIANIICDCTQLVDMVGIKF